MINILYVYQCYQHKLLHNDANALFKFSYSQVTGDIAALAVCTQLTQLGLSRAQVTGDIAALAVCTQLTQLCLYRTQVTGDIAALAACTQLQVLDLDWTEVMAGNYWKYIENIPDYIGNYGKI